MWLKIRRSARLSSADRKEINRLKDERDSRKRTSGRDLSGAEQAGRGEKEIETLADTVKEQIDGLKRMDVQFEIPPQKKMISHETDRTSLERLKKRIVNLRRSDSAFPYVWVNSGEQEMGLRALVKEFAEKIDREEKRTGGI